MHAGSAATKVKISGTQVGRRRGKSFRCVNGEGLSIQAALAEVTQQ